MRNLLAPLLAATLMALPGIACAERPLRVDDAGAIARGDAELEFGWSREGETFGWEGAAGFSPIENVELEVGLSRAQDDTDEPPLTLYGREFAAKWVPLHSDTGLSAGLKYVHEREKGIDVARTRAIYGLLTWRFTGGEAVHVNLGREEAEENEEKEDKNIWGVGFEWPITDTVEAAAEVFGAEHGDRGRAVGLRYEVFPAFKVSGAIGRSNDDRIGNVGVAWEF